MPLLLHRFSGRSGSVTNWYRTNEGGLRVPAAPRPLCLAPFSQDPMISNYHTQVKVTVRYTSTLQLPSVVHVGRFSSVFTESLK
jgi:hypothetical protein